MAKVDKTGNPPPVKPARITGTGKVTRTTTEKVSSSGDETNISQEALQSAKDRSGTVQSAKKTRQATLSDSNQDVEDFQNILNLANVKSEPGTEETTKAAPTTTPQPNVVDSQTATTAGETGDMLIGASKLLNQGGKSITPEQIAAAMTQAQNEKASDPIGRVAELLGVQPKDLAVALGLNTNAVRADQEVRALASILSQQTGRQITPEQVAKAYSDAAQQAQNASGSVLQPNQAPPNLHELAAKNLGVDPAVMQGAINQVPATLGVQPGTTQPPGSTTQPPGATPGKGTDPQNLITPDYLQNLQKMMSGMGINIPPQIWNAQQQMMNQLYGYGLMQQAVQTQRAGLEQYQQVMNTILQMNLSVMQNQTLQLNMIVDARQKMYQMNQAMVQNMFKTNQDVGMGWIKAFSGGQ